MTQSGVAFADVSFHQSPAAYRYYAGTPASHYSPRDQTISSHDLNALAQRFDQQSINQYPTTHPIGYQPNSPVQYHQQIPQYHANESLQAHQSTVRSQRQYNSRLQCQAAHARHLSSLLERMMDSGEQCSICTASRRQEQSAPAPNWEEDETLGDELDEDYSQGPGALSRLNYRRSTDLSANQQGYVSKPIRVRKKKNRGESSRLR